MAEVDVMINSRSYRISCNDGEEKRVYKLVEELDKEVQVLGEKTGQLGEARMILLASLVLLDRSEEQKKLAISSLQKSTTRIEDIIKSIDNEQIQNSKLKY